MDIAAFSDEQLAGQRLMVGFDGTELNQDLMFLIDTLKVGGIILFAGNLSNEDQIKQMCFSVQDYTQSCGQPPLFIAIDQEGGQVSRLGEPFTRFPGNPKIKGKEDAVRFARVTAAELKEVGINMNLAPVLDVVPKGVDSNCYRAFAGKQNYVGCKTLSGNRPHKTRFTRRDAGPGY